MFFEVLSSPYGACINRTRVFFNERSEMPQCHFTRQLTRLTLVGIGAKRRPCNVIFIGTQITRATRVSPAT